MRIVLIWIAAAFVFGNFYTMVAEKEALLRNGQTVYLALSPVDPRSLLQGDYMALNYEIMNQLNHDPEMGRPADRFDPTQGRQPNSGVLVIRIDDQNVGRFARYDHADALAPGEHLLKFHHADWRAVIGAESYFIPEGTGPSFEHAAYGELKLEPDGTPLLVALCDKDHHRLIAAPPAH
jgi:uncharacterized membrane-anchored protein